MSHPVERGLPCQFLLKLWALCPGANSTYLTLEDVEELEKLAKKFTEKSPPHCRRIYDTPHYRRIYDPPK